MKARHESSNTGSWLGKRVLAVPSNSPGPPSKGLPPPAPSNVVDCPSGPVAASAFRVFVARADSVLVVEVVSAEELVGWKAIVVSDDGLVSELVESIDELLESAGAAVDIVVVGFAIVEVSALLLGLL
jgi:hypothetical protein